MIQNILRKIGNRTVGDQTIVEVSQMKPEEERKLFLPVAGDALNITEQYNQIMFFYEAGIRQIRAKLEILNEEFKACNDRNPIESISSRVKSPESIKEKMERQSIPLTVSGMVRNIMDIAGVRVVCPFISDVYHIADLLLRQSDIERIRVKDYIKNRKPNGYRSLHLIVMVTVWFSDHKCEVPVEIQLRTIAMEFWASLEHQLRYKKNRKFTDEMQKQLKECADIVSEADEHMQELAAQWL
ncbi:MAG: GTP pyrophosphokinase [Ruminococcus sp.]|jgi:putative GTP pyrophosphokinase